MKRNRKLFQLIYAAVFAALIFVVTAIIPPLPIGTLGYAHLGDGLIFIAAALLDAPYAIFAAVLGGSLSDLLSPYGSYAMWLPATIIIKGLTALAFTSKKRRMICVRNIVALFISTVLCSGGYYLYEAVVIAKNFASPLISIPFNLMQSVVGAVLFIIISIVFDRTPIVKKFFKFDENRIDIDYDRDK